MNRSLWLLAGLALTGLAQASVPAETQERQAYKGKALVESKFELVSAKNQSVTVLSKTHGIAVFGEDYPIEVNGVAGDPKDAEKGICQVTQRNKIVGVKLVVSQVSTEGALADPVVSLCDKELKIKPVSVGTVVLKVGQTQSSLLKVGEQAFRLSFTYTPTTSTATARK